MIKIKTFQIVIIALILFSFIEYPDVIAQWTLQESGTSLNLWSIHLANDTTGFCVGDNGTIRKTTNGGNNWITIPSPVTINFRYVRMFGLNNIIIGSSSNIILKSTNGGSSWSMITFIAPYDIFTIIKIQFVSFTHGFFIASCSGFTIDLYSTTNGGQNWNCNSINCPYNYVGGANDLYFINENTGWICTQFFEIYPPYPWYNDYAEVWKTTDAGADWGVCLYGSALYNNLDQFRVFFSDIHTGYVNKVEYYQSYLVRTTNGGLSWSPVGGAGSSQNYYSMSFPSSDTGWFTGERTIKSTDGGSNWSAIATPGGNSYQSIFFINNLTGWIVGNNGLVAKTTAGGVNIKPNSNEIHESFKLYQNYPNPFNPLTNIRFDIPKSTHIKIIIYNALGKEVATLVNEKLGAGDYEVDWNGTPYPSGVYFYKLITDEFTNAKKMVLLK